MEIADYKLTDLLSSAGATIGVIIAGTIFLQFVSTKYTELGARYRELTGEYRGRREDEPRHGPLQSQIVSYRRRLKLMHWASSAAAIALLCFLVAVLAGGFSILHPPLGAFKLVGTACLFAGLVLIAAAVSLELAEILESVREHRDETADLDERVRNC